MKEKRQPGPMEEEPDYLPPGPQAEPCEAEVLDDWGKQRQAMPRVLLVWPVASVHWMTG